MPRGSVKPAAEWAPAWGTGVQSSGQKWAKNYVSAGPSIFAKAAASVANWQAAVAHPSAAAKFVGKLKEVNFTVVTNTVNGPGLQKFIAAGLNKQANMNHFAGIMQPKLASIVAGLPARGPSGAPVNRTRLNQLLDGLEATKGKNF